MRVTHIHCQDLHDLQKCFCFDHPNDLPPGQLRKELKAVRAEIEAFKRVRASSVDESEDVVNNW